MLQQILANCLWVWAVDSKKRSPGSCAVRVELAGAQFAFEVGPDFGTHAVCFANASSMRGRLHHPLSFVSSARAPGISCGSKGAHAVPRGVP